MLSWRCRRFRTRFSPAGFSPAGTGKAHRRRCAECAAYAAALERMAAARLPLPERLRADLSALALQPASRALGLDRLPVPALPLPPALRSRLQGIAREAERPRPPLWIVSPRYAVAASLLLTVLTAALLRNPGELGIRAVDFVGREVTREVAPPLAAAAAARESGVEKLAALRTSAVSRYTEIRGGVGASVEGLETRVSQIAGRLLPASPDPNSPRRTR